MTVEMNRFVLSAAVVAVLGITAGQAGAGLLAYDGFESYTPSTTTTVAGGNGGTGWVGAWQGTNVTNPVVRDSAYDYSNGVVVIDGGDQSLRLSHAHDAYINRQFATQTGTVYFSLLLTVNTALANNHYVVFALSDSPSQAQSAASGLNNTSNTTLGVRLTSTDFNSASNVSSNTSVFQNQTYLLVGRVAKEAGLSPTAYDRLDLWVNPATLTEPAYNARVNRSIHPGSTLSWFTVRTVNLNGTQDYRLDEIRIGTTWESVVAIPEPATLALLAAGAVVMLSRRRENHA